jgi:hypothetical protein
MQTKNRKINKSDQPVANSLPVTRTCPLNVNLFCVSHCELTASQSRESQWLKHLSFQAATLGGAITLAMFFPHRPQIECERNGAASCSAVCATGADGLAGERSVCRVASGLWSERLLAEQPGFECRQGQSGSGAQLGLNRMGIGNCPGIRRPKRKPDHSPPFSAKM